MLLESMQHFSHCYDLSMRSPKHERGRQCKRPQDKDPSSQYVSSHEDAEDMLLDVSLAAIESDALLQLVEQQQVAWLRRAAYHKAMDLYRQRTRQPLLAHPGRWRDSVCG